MPGIYDKLSQIFHPPRIGTIEPPKDEWGLPKISSQIIAKSFKNELEKVAEIIGLGDGLGFSLAIADIKNTPPHFHSARREVYTVVSGRLRVTIDGKDREVNPGESVHIPPNTIHEAVQAGEKPVRVLVLCVPGWIPEDHCLTSLGMPSKSSKVLAVSGDPRANIPYKLYRKASSYSEKRVYEIIMPSDGLGFSAAIVELLKEAPVLGSKSAKTIIVFAGTTTIKLADGSSFTLSAGDMCKIPENMGWKYSVSSYNPVRVLISSLPGCEPNDY